MTDAPRRWIAPARGVCRAASALSAGAFVVLAAATFVAPSGATPVGGEAQIVTPQDGSSTSGQPLSEGSLTTPFSLKLPAGAACTGDSSEGGYRVQSFMVPDGVDPAGLTFGALGPLPKGVGSDFRQPLYAVSTAAFANAATNLADEPGGPGTIINIPSFNLDVFSGGDLPPGQYSIGIACTRGAVSATQLDRYWTAMLELSEGSGAAGALSWTAAATSPSTGAPDAEAPAGSEDQEPADAGGDDVSVAVEPDSTVAGDPASPRPSGGQPTFNISAGDIAENLSIAGDTTTSLVLWLVIALVSARIAYLLARTPGLLRGVQL